MIDAADWQVIRFTLAVAIFSTLLSAPFAMGLAWLLARKEWRGKSIVETLVLLPLVMPPVATGFILLKLFGRRGPVGEFLEDRLGLEIVFTWRGVVIALAVMSFPLLVRTMRVGFEGVHERYEQVARTLGATAWQSFYRVTLPLARRALIGGLVLGFGRALGEFGATIIIAGAIPGKTATMAVSIFNLIQLGNDRRAFALLAVSVFFSFGALWWSELMLRPKSRIQANS